MAPRKNTAQQYRDLLAALRAGNAPAVTLLQGEEGYYIDRLLEAAEALVAEDDRDFNLFTFYGGDAQPGRVVEACRQIPMMGDRVVVILKEAQAMRADALDKIAPYVLTATPSTALFLAFRGSAAKGKELTAAVKQAGATVFSSDKLPDDSAVAPLLAQLVKERGMSIEPKGLSMLADHVGRDLSRLYNEVDKLQMILGSGAMVTPEAIERNIGISKDYNNFELVDAIALKDSLRAFRIVAYFRANPKANPVQPTAGTLFTYFTNLIAMHFSPDKNPDALARAAGFKSRYAVTAGRYEQAMRNYNAWQTMEILSEIRRFEGASKGIGSRQDPYLLLHDLIFRILTAQGSVTV